MTTGIVKSYDIDKGIGYIVPDQGGPDVFLHYSSFMGDTRDVERGAKVQFQLTHGARGPLADRVFQV